jgi:hypothetical protein
MRAAFPKMIAAVMVYVTLSGCLQNSVHPITATRPPHPDTAHSIVVVGVGLDAAWPFAAFSLALDEYSFQKHDITGNCFRYNHIQATRPSTPAKVTYFAFKVPAGAYVYSPFNGNARLASSAPATGFIAPPGKTVYFGDYVFVGNQTVELRSDIDAARLGVRSLLPNDLTLEQATPAHIGYAHPFMCTP